MLRRFSAAVAAAILVACSSQAQVTQQSVLPSQQTFVHRTFDEVEKAARRHQTAAQATANIFAEARGASLSDSDLDAYIDPSVTGNDREIAHKLMAFMPSNQRGDFVYLAPNGHLVSNNPQQLKYVSITKSAGDSSPHARIKSQSTVRPMDYFSPCSPPNPPTSPGGPYARNVSPCGFTAGFGIVNVKCGTTQLISSEDAGHLYFELQGTGQGTSYGKSLTEGGLEYYSDTSVAPYLRSSYYAYIQNSNGYVNMTNSGVRYACGQNLVIEHGATYNENYTYTQVGQLPPQYSPSTSWINYGTFSLNNAAWLFLAAPGDIVGSGTDNAGVYTPCAQCSISEVSSIAQNNLPAGTGYQADGSYFGLDQNGAEIHWMQVAFGEWESDCEPNTTLCTFISSRSINKYLGGSQIYPGSTVAETWANPLGYGPYETYDTVDLQGGGIPASRQKAGGSFTVPTPPPATPTPPPGPTPTPRPKPTPTPPIKCGQIICQVSPAAARSTPGKP